MKYLGYLIGLCLILFGLNIQKEIDRNENSLYHIRTREINIDDPSIWIKSKQ